ncbi:uncharacterized protein LAESUDRAFT_800192, partial [Laetiporus sulphureus 93-53]
MTMATAISESSSSCLSVARVLAFWTMPSSCASIPVSSESVPRNSSPMRCAIVCFPLPLIPRGEFVPYRLRRLLVHDAAQRRVFERERDLRLCVLILVIPFGLLVRFGICRSSFLTLGDVPELSDA